MKLLAADMSKRLLELALVCWLGKSLLWPIECWLPLLYSDIRPWWMTSTGREQTDSCQLTMLLVVSFYLLSFHHYCCLHLKMVTLGEKQTLFTLPSWLASFFFSWFFQVLIMDHPSTRIVSACFKMSDLLAEGITSEWLEQESLATRGYPQNGRCFWPWRHPASSIYGTYASSLLLPYASSLETYVSTMSGGN